MITTRLAPLRLGAAATLLLGLAPLCGCTFVNAYEDPPIVGDWKREIPNINSGDEMSLELDGGGDGVIFFTIGGGTDVFEGEYDIEWTYRSSDEYDLDWECSNDPCAGFDFTLRCDINRAGDELECVDRSGVWTSGEFSWVDD